MLISSSYLATLLLPTIVVAQNAYYTVTVGGQVTSFELPPFVQGPAVATPTPSVAVVVPQSSGPVVQQSGTTIPVTVGGQETSIILPTWSGDISAAGYGPVPVPTLPSDSVSAVLNSASAAVSSVVSEASSAVNAVGSQATSVASNVVSSATSITGLAAAGGSLTAATTLPTSLTSTVTAYQTTLYGSYSSAVAAASGASTASSNTTVTVSAPSGGFATFTVPADTAVAGSNATGTPTTSGLVQYTGGANAMMKVENSMLMTIIVGLVAWVLV